MAGSDRAGKFIRQTAGYAAFIPNPLPPHPTVRMDGDLLTLFSDAQVALGRLDGLIKIIPDPDFFVGMYVRREAVLSSQIEGTQSTLEDLLEIELQDKVSDPHSDVGDIVNYVEAMNSGLDMLDELPLSLRLIKEIHAVLLSGGRGANATPGEFRRTQNWIGPAGAGIDRATFVPPPEPEMKTAMGDFETFLVLNEEFPVLVKAGLAHAQFESIHPFLDGNGRIGRLLITFLLVHEKVLRKPALYLSYFFKLNRAEYYDRLMAVRLNGDWEGWLKFFLRGVVETANEAATTAERVFEMRERHRALIIAETSAQNGLRLLSQLFLLPIVNVNYVATTLDVSYPTANNLVAKFVELGLLTELTGQQRSRLFRYEPYVALFNDPPNPGLDDTTLEVTDA